MPGTMVFNLHIPGCEESQGLVWEGPREEEKSKKVEKQPTSTKAASGPTLGDLLREQFEKKEPNKN